MGWCPVAVGVLPLALAAGCVRADIRPRDGGAPDVFTEDGEVRPEDGGPPDADAAPAYAISIPEGRDGFVEIGPSKATGLYPPTFTYEVYVDLRTLHSHSVFTSDYVFHAGDISYHEIFLRTATRSGEGLECGVGDGAGEHLAIAPASAYQAGRGLWTHVACTLDAMGTLRIWISGELAGEARSAVFVAPPPTTILSVGGSWLGRASIDGRVDELRISRVARYTGTFVPGRRLPPDAETIALWHLDEGTGTPREERLDIPTVLSGVATWVRE
jgi:hypothetical protein